MSGYAVRNDGLGWRAVGGPSDIVDGENYMDAAEGLPPDPVPAALTADEIKAVNTALQAELLASASAAMTPLLISLQLGDATDSETVSAKSWQAYCRTLKLVDLTVVKPAWPVSP